MSASIYLLVGEPFLADEALDRIRAEAGTDPLAEDVFTSDAASASLQTALETPSLLGGRRLVVVQDAHDLNKEQSETLARYVDSPSPNAVLVLIASRRTKLDAQVRKSGSVITLDVPKGRKLVAWIRERSRERKLQMDDRAAWALIDAVGNELRDIDGALSQLQTQFGDGARVSAQDVRKAFARLADERIFALTDAVGDRRVPAAMAALRRLLLQGDEPLMILGALTGHVRRLVRARRYADQGPNVVAQALGLPRWRAERLHKQARSYREEELVSAMSVLAEADIELKSGGTQQQSAAALEKAVLNIVQGVPARMF